MTKTKSTPFRDLASALDKIKGTSSKKEKVKIFAEYLSKVPPEDAEVAARIATGRSSTRGSKLEAQVGYSTLMEALKDVTGGGEEVVSRTYLKYGDLGEVAQEMLGRKTAAPLMQEDLSISDLEEAFGKLRRASGRGSSSVRLGVVKSLILRATPIEGKYIIKVLTGEMRTGIVSGLVEEAVAVAYSMPREQVARAHMLLGDVGVLAGRAATGDLDSVQMSPFVPVNFMLAEPLSSPEEVEDHFGKQVYAEYKYDGVRAQVHKKGKTVRVYSRRLEDISESFPEVIGRSSVSRRDFIMDGEIVPFEDGKPLPFQLLQRRLRRIEGFEEASSRAPVEFFAFDLLYLDGVEVSQTPLSERRLRLGKICEETSIMTAASEDVSTREEIARLFRKSRELGYEGLVMKDPDSVYSMGKRGSAWVKLKEELDTIDAVIVAAEYGHGKRAGVISDYTFAVWEGKSLKTIGKAYSGLTDAEIDEMTVKLKEITVKDYGYRRSVRPEIVVEVAFDSIQRSERHDSGYALRFPRIKRIRTDKAPAQADDIKKVADLYARQKVKV